MPFDRQPELQLRDAGGRDLKQAGVTITVGLASGTGTLSGTTSAVTDADGRAAFTDLAKPKPGVMDWRTFKSEVTRALREQTEKGIEHPVPQVKAAAEVIRGK